VKDKAAFKRYNQRQTMLNVDQAIEEGVEEGEDTAERGNQLGIARPFTVVSLRKLSSGSGFVIFDAQEELGQQELSHRG